MQSSAPLFVLASRSPRRLELLSQIVPIDAIRVLPPVSSDEAGFDGLRSLVDVETRLTEIAAAKCGDVLRQLGDEGTGSVVIAADTVVVAGEREHLAVLGQPPEASWRETTRHWFSTYYAGRAHSVLTGLCVSTRSGLKQRIVTTQVTFREDVAALLDWYLDTEEPRGKAGGYAIQGAGSLFVERIEGSLTNVIGLPLRELFEVLDEAGVAMDNRPRNGTRSQPNLQRR
ncbi:MAG: Maf family protein [Planctomycetota bacterium]|nr:Maf family protein [Planctomycetaceae bacterium]MDQ3329732.1 Maf family protein [Planctomycetota bacterium]